MPKYFKIGIQLGIKFNLLLTKTALLFYFIYSFILVKIVS